jgi:hypothetical protein
LIKRRNEDAIHGDCEGRQQQRSRRDAEHGIADSHGQVQRKDGEGRRHARGRGPAPEFEGTRIKYSGKDRTVTNGPFSATNELVSGFWLIQVKSREEAIEWMKRAPFDGGAEIEIRQVFDAEDFGEALTPRTARAGATSPRASGEQKLAIVIPGQPAG